MISLLSPEGVSREFLHRAEWAGGAEAIDEALGRLVDASLLSFGGGEGSREPLVIAHRIVTRVARERRTHDGTLIAVGTEICAMLAAAAKSLGEPWRHRTAARDLVRQVIALHDHLAPYVSADDEALAEALLARRAWALKCLNDLGDSAAQARQVGEPLLTDSVRVLGEDHPRTLRSRNNLASAYQAAGRVAEAIPLFEQALAGFERVLGEEHPDTVIVRENLTSARQEAEPSGETPPA